MYFNLKMGLKTEISPKYCNIKAITHKNNDFQPFFSKIGTHKIYMIKFKISSVMYFIIIEI